MKHKRYYWILAIILCTSVLYLGCNLLDRSYDSVIEPDQMEVTSNGGTWLVSLDGGGWRGGTITVDLTITNIGTNLASFSDFMTIVGLVAKDSYGKEIKGKTGWYYAKEVYPGDSVSGRITFAFNPKSGPTKLYFSRWISTRIYIFELGSPREVSR